LLSKSGLLSDQPPAPILLPENFASQIFKNDIYYKRKVGMRTLQPLHFGSAFGGLHDADSAQLRHYTYGRSEIMDRFTAAIRKSLESQNWYAALYMSMTLPDICARLESDDGKTNANRYMAWFEKYLADNYKREIGPDRHLHVFLSGADCYALRCAILHEGITDITTQRCRDAVERFHFTVVGAHCNQFNFVLQLDVPTFCNDVCRAAERWIDDFRTNHPDKLNRLDQIVKVHVGPHSMNGGISFG
jgi:hypothetical protein